MLTPLFTGSVTLVINLCDFVFCYQMELTISHLISLLEKVNETQDSPWLLTIFNKEQLGGREGGK